MGLTEAGAALAGAVLADDAAAAAVALYLASLAESHDRLAGYLARLERKVDHLTTQQDTLNADVAQINATLAAFDTQTGLLGEDVQAIALALQAAQNDNPGIDLSGLTAATQGLAARQAELTAAVAAATVLAPPPVAGAGTVTDPNPVGGPVQDDGTGDGTADSTSGDSAAAVPAPPKK